MSSKRMKLFLKIALLLLQLQFLQTKQTCPQISMQSQPHFYEAFYTGGYLKIPNTNILLVNTITYSKAQNIIYYIDISSSIDNMLQVIQPSFPINSMEYVQQRNQILALTTQAVIYVDPYTLEYIETALQSSFTFQWNVSSKRTQLCYSIRQPSCICYRDCSWTSSYYDRLLGVLIIWIYLKRKLLISLKRLDICCCFQWCISLHLVNRC
ncbi:hypothetical protein ABPG72_007884 [Tetrahymena utriculariae]